MAHRAAYRAVERQLLGRVTLNGVFHDLDKFLLYLFGLPTETAHAIHKRLSSHHVKNGRIKNPVGAVIDWECARYTKPDMQSTAFEYYKKTFPKGLPFIEETLKKLGLWGKSS